MKHQFFSLASVALLLGLSVPALADTPEPVEIAAPQLAAEPEVQGMMLVGAVTRLLGTTGVAVGMRYWHDYFGGDLSLGFDRIGLDIAGNDILKTTAFNVNFAGLAGFPIGRIKPHLRLGFGFYYSKDSVNDFTHKEFDLIPSVAIDFRISEHCLLGVDLLSFPVLLWGDNNLGGSGISLLNGLRIAYVF